MHACMHMGIEILANVGPPVPGCSEGTNCENEHPAMEKVSPLLAALVADPWKAESSMHDDHPACN